MTTDTHWIDSVIALVFNQQQLESLEDSLARMRIDRHGWRPIIAMTAIDIAGKRNDLGVYQVAPATANLKLGQFQRAITRALEAFTAMGPVGIHRLVVGLADERGGGVPPLADLQSMVSGLDELRRASDRARRTPPATLNIPAGKAGLDQKRTDAYRAVLVMLITSFEAITGKRPPNSSSLDKEQRPYPFYEFCRVAIEALGGPSGEGFRRHFLGAFRAAKQSAS